MALFSSPLSQSPALLNLSGFATLMPLALGVIGTVSPAAALKIFDFDDKTLNPQARKLGTNLMLFQSSRDLFMAGVNLAGWWYGDRKMLGIISFLGCAVAINDGWMSERQLGRGAWKHVAWVPVVASLGAALMGWFD
ncbi:hypothetical protein Micbo1qcDRAFT_11362 [Microdochium bolleyi]|uniref:Integral membrane protein n=1 Tax=Microdochium bolleyi TaxID=196109 RepID=A0A136IYN1_9PEZI|nr:hypothetical protein Micbo1qcDRAFT_11362 [Microdochium bolleyi]